MTYSYYCPPGSRVYIANPDWLGRSATVSRGAVWEVGRQELELYSGPGGAGLTHDPNKLDMLAPYLSDRPLVIEWYLQIDGYWYTSTAAESLETGVHAGRWALSAAHGEWRSSLVLTIQDRSSKPSDPGYSNRPMLVYDAQGNGYGPSQVMETGSMTIHRLSEWRSLWAQTRPEGTGWWAYDFEWAPGAAWSLIRHKSGTDTKRATHVRDWDHETT